LLFPLSYPLYYIYYSLSHIFGSPFFIPCSLHRIYSIISFIPIYPLPSILIPHPLSIILYPLFSFLNPLSVIPYSYSLSLIPTLLFLIYLLFPIPCSLSSIPFQTYSIVYSTLSFPDPSYYIFCMSSCILYSSSPFNYSLFAIIFLCNRLCPIFHFFISTILYNLPAITYPLSSPI